MRLLSLCFICVVCLLAATPSARAQRDAPQPLVVSLPQGGFVAFRMKTTPLDINVSTADKESELRLPLTAQVLADDGNVVHRLLVDDKGVLIFGYDLVVEPLATGQRFKVSARPLDREFEARLRARSGAVAARGAQTPFNVSTLAGATGEQHVADGETFALDLMVNEQLGLKVVDYVKVSAEKSRLFAPPVPSPARDFAVTNVELAVNNYQLQIDGETLRTSGVRRSCAGALVWFSLPGRGRFIFSLAPHEGYDFRKVGLVEDNKIAFTWGDVRYEWISDAPIVGSGGGAWNLWVLHDPHDADTFAPPPVAEDRQESKFARVLRDPLRVLAERRGDLREEGGSRSAEKRSARVSERVRVRVGGADRIETLLPKI